jgi:hypothetical protein
LLMDLATVPLRSPDTSADIHPLARTLAKTQV